LYPRIRVTQELLDYLDSTRSIGQTYGGIIQELINIHDYLTSSLKESNDKIEYYETILRERGLL